MRDDLSAEYVRALLHYDPITGIFRWLAARRGIRVGDVAGNPSNRAGYRSIMIDGKNYRSSRLAWLYMTGEWPPAQVDHKNLNRTDDRFENLRPATGSQNGANKRRPSHNTSGFKGVTWVSRDAKWRAQIVVGGQSIYLGLYSDFSEACAVRVRAAEHYFGEFARAA